MTNKRFWLGILVLVLVLVFGITVVGCKEEPPEIKTYYYEAYRITMVQYNTFNSTVSGGQNYTFSQIQGFRHKLRSYNGTFVESNSGISESELKTFANQQGFEGSTYTQIKDSLDSVGNLILFSFPSNYVIWTYIEKE